MMGGMLGLVGLGRVRLSLNMALLPRSRAGLETSTSAFSLLDKMEDWDTPVDGALAMRLAALGVAVCRIGLLIVGLRGIVGLDGLSGSLSDEGDMVAADDEGEVIDDDAGEAVTVGDDTVGEDLDDETVVVVVNELG